MIISVDRKSLEGKLIRKIKVSCFFQNTTLHKKKKIRKKKKKSSNTQKYIVTNK